MSVPIGSMLTVRINGKDVVARIEENHGQGIYTCELLEPQSDGAQWINIDLAGTKYTVEKMS